ncbi:hypothetical protein TetV_215 [Tetraselmis virus 1]|uniref:Uncharacterized protein n=1 Tax=Tetraselmis virus 1 TaxID=2060617 RepID=A0A2P0VN13_9VIRU|nr:hypothetical protein QJ968_gp215 [Tetraselmis virus 1]AUF82307.1 hypothetical protein TetV_215 [Tetraselmis virus 1]
MSRLFYNLHRPTDDQCYATVEEDYNKSIYDYNIYNYYNQPRKDLINFASENVNLRFGDGEGTSAPGTIDVESQMKNKPKWTPRGVQQLAVRTYQAVPDMSGGSVWDTSGEETVKWSDNNYNRSTALSGVFIEQQYYPLIPALEQEVQDPEFIIYPWARGGESTREASRTLAFMQTQGYQRGAVPSSSGRQAPFVKSDHHPTQPPM